LSRDEEKKAEQAQRFVDTWRAHCDRIKFNTLTPLRAPKTAYDTGRICDDIFHNIHVEWDGTVPLCGYQHLITAPETMGRAGEAPLTKIWKNPRWEEVRRGHLQHDLSKSDFCRYCFAQQCLKTIYGNMAEFNMNRSRLRAALERVAWKVLS
jgi:hypothetical protein